MTHILTRTLLTTAMLMAGNLLLTAAPAYAESAEEARLRDEADNDLGHQKVRELLTQGTNPNVRGFKGLTAVHAAAGGCAKQNLEVILKHGGDATVRDTDGNTPLHHAAGAIGGADLVCAPVTRLLVQHDAPVNQANQSGNTALHLAAKGGGKEDIMAVLLDAGANPRAINGDGLTPLQLFVKDGTNEGRVVALLLDAGADPNRKTPEGYTPLHVTLKTGGSYGKPEVVEALLAGNADPCIRDPEGYIPYQYTVVHENAPLHDALDRAGGFESACENRAKRSSQESVAVDRERPANTAKSSGPSQESVAADLKPKCIDGGESDALEACWREIQNKSGCYVYLHAYYISYILLPTYEPVTWSGSCSDNLANGDGTLTFSYKDDPAVSTFSGSLVDGKLQGNVVVTIEGAEIIRDAEGLYLDGKVHGRWISRYVGTKGPFSVCEEYSNGGRAVSSC